MAVTANDRSPDQVRREIEAERAQLTDALDSLRSELGEVTDVGARLRENLPAATAAAAVGGFLLSGGIGATMRLLARRGRERK